MAEVGPNEKGKITVTVDTSVPAVKVGHISKYVEVWTNDSNRQMITLVVTGEVLPVEEKR